LNWKYAIIGFCMPINIILIVFGIIIGDPFAIVLASISTGLVVMPALGDYYEKKEKNKEPDDKRPSS